MLCKGPGAQLGLHSWERILTGSSAWLKIHVLIKPEPYTLEKRALWTPSDFMGVAVKHNHLRHWESRTHPQYHHPGYQHSLKSAPKLAAPPRVPHGLGPKWPSEQ